MFYYKVYDEDKFLGVATSLHLRYYSPKIQRILCCHEEGAQYVRLDNEQLYHIYCFADECAEMRGKYPDARLCMATKEEYDEYMAKMAKVESEQK